MVRPEKAVRRGNSILGRENGLRKALETVNTRRGCELWIAFEWVKGKQGKERLGQIWGPLQQWGAIRESRYCVHFIEHVFDYQFENTLFFTMLTLNHSQLFLGSVGPHLVLALGFDLFALSPSLVFTVLVLYF